MNVNTTLAFFASSRAFFTCSYITYNVHPILTGNLFDVGPKLREIRRKFKPFLPLIIRGNVRSLVDKMDELGALMRTQQEYQAETWLQEQLQQLSAQL